MNSVTQYNTATRSRKKRNKTEIEDIKTNEYDDIDTTTLSTPSKRRRLNNSSKNTKKLTFNKTKADIWVYLLLTYIFEIRHENDKIFKDYISYLETYKKLIPNYSYINYVIIDDDTSLDLESIPIIILNRLDLGFANNKCSFHYFVNCYVQPTHHIIFCSTCTDRACML